MPTTTETRTLGELYAELEEHMAALVEAADDAAEDDRDDAVDDLEAYANSYVEPRLRDIAALREEYGADAALVIGQLTLDERANYLDYLEAAREQWSERAGVESKSGFRRKLWYVAAAVVDAPWLDGEEDIPDRAAALRSEVSPRHDAVEVLFGVATEVNESESGNVKSFAERRAASRPTNAPN